MHIIFAIAIGWTVACTVRASIFILWIVKRSRIETPHVDYPDTFREWLYIFVGSWCMVVPTELAGFYGYICDHVNTDPGV